MAQNPQMAPVTPRPSGAKSQLSIGVVRETKIPGDRRTPLTPQQCQQLMQRHPDVTVVVQSSPSRCYADQEYRAVGVAVSDSVDDCSVLLGVKEVSVDALLAGRTYFFFSHTIKEQAYNARLLAAVLRRGIRLVDYECLRDGDGKRVIAFGRWAGVVGAHNTVSAWGRRHRRFQLPELHRCRDFAEGSRAYAGIDLRGLRLVLTGAGRVSTGVEEVLRLMGVKRVTKDEFLAGEVAANSDQEAVYVQLLTRDIYRRSDTGLFDRGFYKEPQDFDATNLMPYLLKANALVNGIYWDCRAPAFFDIDDVSSPKWTLEVIGDITCDIAPKASVPLTLRATRIGDAYFGYDRQLGCEAAKELTFDNSGRVVTMMTVDNLPNELPRDSSEDFGRQFMEFVLPQLLAGDSPMLQDATIAAAGSLGQHYCYLRDYAQAGMRQL